MARDAAPPARGETRRLAGEEVGVLLQHRLQEVGLPEEHHDALLELLGENERKKEGERERERLGGRTPLQEALVDKRIERGREK